MIKWKLMLTTLPVVVAVILMKFALDAVFGLRGWLDFGDVAPVLTAGAFLIGFMLAGTMADYKESEKLPSEIAAMLDSLDDLITVSAIKPEFDANAARRSLVELGERIVEWLLHRTPIDAVYAAIAAMIPHYQAMDQAGAIPHANRSIVFMNAVRRGVGRIDVVARTGFLPTGYAILEVMVGVVLLLLLASRFKSEVAEYTLVSCITLIYVYMLRLIRDVDNPFEYDATIERRGAGEVDLFPMTEVVGRLRSRVAASGPQG